MEAQDWDSSSGGESDTEIYSQDTNDDEHDYTSGSVSKLQFRKEISKARWNEQMQMAEVVEKKGKLWTTTGLVRSAKTYCLIEEILFLTEIGALDLLDDNDTRLSIKHIYEKISEEKSGCSWALYEVYRHLKSLGYIVGRHGIPWSLKGVMNSCSSVSLQDTSDSNGEIDMGSETVSSIIDLLKMMEIKDVRPAFDVYLPNSKFRKSCPGDPNFVLCLTRGYPPSKADIEVLEGRCGIIPLKFCHAEHGRISFFTFKRLDLPVLP